MLGLCPQWWTLSGKLRRLPRRSGRWRGRSHLSVHSELWLTPVMTLLLSASHKKMLGDCPLCRTLLLRLLLGLLLNLYVGPDSGPSGPLGAHSPSRSHPPRWRLAETRAEDEGLRVPVCPLPHHYPPAPMETLGNWGRGRGCLGPWGPTSRPDLTRPDGDSRKLGWRTRVSGFLVSHSPPRPTHPDGDSRRLGRRTKTSGSLVFHSPSRPHPPRWRLRKTRVSGSLVSHSTPRWRLAKTGAEDEGVGVPGLPFPHPDQVLPSRSSVMTVSLGD